MDIKVKKIKERRANALPYNSSSQQEVDLKLKAIGDSREVSGYLAVFGVKDMSGDIFVKGCFAKSIKERGPKSASKYKIKMLWAHDQKDPIGQFTELVEDDYGLKFTAKIDEVESGDRFLVQAKSGTVNQYSVGYLTVWDKVEWNEEENALMHLEVNLFEGSPVSIPDNMETYTLKSLNDMVNAKEELEVETEETLEGLSREKQYEIRQLITKHLTLASKSKPGKDPLDEEDEPKQSIGLFGALCN